MKEIIRLNVNLTGEAADKFKRVKAHLGLAQDSEVIRALIAYYYSNNEEKLTGPPKMMWHINLNDNGVWIWDPDLQKAVTIHFKPEGIKCEHDRSDSCKHVLFALSLDEVKEVINKKKKEGWKLPDV
jgi:hypothetical protein